MIFSLMLTTERERLESLFAMAMQKVEESLRSSVSYQKSLDERLSRLPDQIKKGISPEDMTDRKKV